MVSYAHEIDKAQTAYSNRCEAIAEAIRQELVIPFCRRRRLEFAGGMGTWAFYKIGGKPGDNYSLSDLERWRGTKRLIAALELSVDHNNSLGTSYVRDVRKEDL